MPHFDSSDGGPCRHNGWVCLTALQKATETHLAYRPELKSELSSKRSLEEAAAVLQQEFFETQQVCKSVDEEVAKLREKLIAAEAEQEAVAVSAAERESALYSKV